MTAEPAAWRLEMSGISKRFHGQLALDDVNLHVRPGEVHAIVGENGAGKSTLIKILTGVYRPDAGRIMFEGRQVAFPSPHEAQQAGIATIYQEVNLIPTLSGAENIWLGREPRKRFGYIDWGRMASEASSLLRRYGIDMDVRRPVEELGLASQQMIAIVRALSLGGRILVMDEPTSALTHREVDYLLEIVGRIRDDGVSVIYISHRLDELFRVGNRVTVLRDGRNVLTDDITNMTKVDLVTAMLGRELQRTSRLIRDLELTIAEGRPLSAISLRRLPRVQDASVTVRPGEVVGLAGLQGSGRTEFMRLVFGADDPDAGEVTTSSGRPRPRSPGESLGQGVAYLPEDRKADGIVPDLSLRENMTLIVLPALTRMGVISRRREREVVDRFIERLGIRAAHADVPIRDLSGGNQQKVLVARLLCSNPTFLLLDDPMRGIDVGAKAEIERLIRELAGEGIGVLMCSSELEEVLSISDRITVMRDGRTVSDIDRYDATLERVTAAIAEGSAADSRAEVTAAG